MAEDFFIFDSAAVAAHRRRALGLDPRQRFLRDEIRHRMLDRLADLKRRFSGRILDLGTLDAARDKASLARASLTRAAGDDPARPTPTIVSLDLAASGGDGSAVIGSAELMPFARESFDLVFSVLGLQWVNDLPGALVQIRTCMKPDGLLLAALLGGRTLHELREVLTRAEIEIAGGASPRVSPFVDLRSAAGLLQRTGMALPVADLETITLTYPSFFALAAELRALGETNGLNERARHPTGRKVMLRAAELYREFFHAGDGRIRATFDVIMLTGWAPAPSQPKPLRPGSAKYSLADELGKDAG